MSLMCLSFFTFSDDFDCGDWLLHVVRHNSENFSIDMYFYADGLA